MQCFTTAVSFCVENRKMFDPILYLLLKVGTYVSHSEILKNQNAGLVYIMIIVKYVLELDFILNNWTK